jgi:hypothetical protein
MTNVRTPPFNLKSEVDRGDPAQSAGRECHSSGFAVFINTPQPSSCHRDSASCAISSPPTSEFRFILMLGALALAGCSSGGGGGAAHNGQEYSVIAQRTMFYSFGPSQTTGPDFALYNGQQVKMLQYAFGFSRIKVEGSGQAGYVATEDLVPAPATPAPSPSPGASRHHHREDERAPTAEEQGRIPLPEFPEAKPPPDAPPFRY